jgi:adenine deaminase
MPAPYSALIAAARGIVPADIVYRNAEIFDAFSGGWEHADLAVKGDTIVGIGRSYQGLREQDLHGRYLLPGLIDAHVHIESSLLLPHEYARLVARHGTTTVIADPHEIANVAGIAGIEFMLSGREQAATDILFMLPSCVPAIPADVGGAVLDASALAPFIGREGVLGIGEMMNVPGVLEGNPKVLAKLALSGIRDGHAPLLSGNDLNAYILAGLQSDHECTNRDEAEEKLRRGMYIYIREGSTEHNIAALVPLVTAANVSRCCFATDDCHADLLEHDGHIDRCIRRAVACGLEPELAIRMATLSAAERFGLADRGALAPGRRADLCVIDNLKDVTVLRTILSGREAPITIRGVPLPALPPGIRCSTPSSRQIRITGAGRARVIGLVPRQIITETLRFDIEADSVPDRSRDVLKAVVCNRYGQPRIGIGLVHGFGFTHGAIAASIAHDAHNIVAVGVEDKEILRALDGVIRAQGGMAAVIGKNITLLPLDCGGLMSTLPYPDVVGRLDNLHVITSEMEGIDDPFMYLSFLALTVIPALRLTDRGVFDAVAFRDVPLYEE